MKKHRPTWAKSPQIDTTLLIWAALILGAAHLGAGLALLAFSIPLPGPEELTHPGLAGVMERAEDMTKIAWGAILTSVGFLALIFTGLATMGQTRKTPGMPESTRENQCPG